MAEPTDEFLLEWAKENYKHPWTQSEKERFQNIVDKWNHVQSLLSS